MEKLDVIKSIETLVQKHGPWDGLEIEGVEIKQVEMKGGEGQGEHTHVVYEVSHDGLSYFIMMNGYYESYEGTDYSYAKAKEVVPYEKTVQDWKEV